MGSKTVAAGVLLTCQDCRITKSEDQFHRHSGKINGRRSACKDCSNTAHRQRNARRTGQQAPAPRPPLVSINSPTAVWANPAIRGELPGIWGSDLVHYKGESSIEQNANVPGIPSAPLFQFSTGVTTRTLLEV